MKKKYVSRLLAGCLTVTMLTPTGALASVPQPAVTQEASQEAGQENKTENKEQTEEYAAEGAAEVQTDETEAAENRTAADKSREQTEPQTAQTGEQAEPQTTQTGEQAASEAEPQAQVQPRAVVAVNQWIRNGNRWWYRHADGSYTTNGWEVINGAWYYFDGAGWMVTGWLKRPSGWYYLTGSGAMATGWIQLGSTWYYLNESGTMLADTWIGNNYVDGSGAWIPGKVKAQAGWIQSGNRWWYRHADGSYTTNGWEVINGAWYYFDGAGWMVTGWVKLSGTWYYLTGSGAMATGWIQTGGTWYYMNTSGAMVTDTWIGNNYVDGSGAWIPGKVKAQAGWIQSGNRWWYRHADGSYTRNNWEMINGSWYYFDGAGWMVTGWLKLGNNWYYLNPGNGAMVTGWLQLGSTWYYMNGSGAMETDTWIGNSYVDANGVWDQSKTKAQAYWVLNGDRWMLVQEDGTYAKKCWKTVDGKEYYLDENGYMVTGWLKQGSTWYYLKPTAKNSAEKVGEKAYNYWVGTAGIGGYYIDKYGRMVAGKDYSLGSYVYTFDASGLCTNRENRYLQVTDANGRKYNVEKKTYLSDPQVGVDVTEDEFLAAAVYAESANQGLTGMTGVAMVMLNRMRTNKTSSAPYPSEAKNMIYQATQFEVARDGALTKSLNLIVSGKGGTAMENAKKAVANARAICDAYDNNKTDDLSDEVQGILKELKIPEGHTMLEYLGFMTPKAFENANLDPEKTHAFTYKNTTFYSTWIKKS
ncbi:MAG: cell wall hydrolase [Lachnospiraceae bacterium]